MEVYISINGALRNLIERFEYCYNKNFLESDVELETSEPFDYKITNPICNDNLLNHFSFQSLEEYNNFLFVDYPLEIFGQSTISYTSAMSDLNKLIYENPNINFTVIGLDEFAKSKSSTLYFLSKYSYLGNNVKFILTKDIEKEWEKCDVWVTDNKYIVDRCPNNKQAVKFNTKYNVFFTHKIEIKNLTTCLKSLENITTSTWNRRLKNVARYIPQKIKKLKNLKIQKNINLN